MIMQNSLMHYKCHPWLRLWVVVAFAKRTSAVMHKW